MPKTPTRGRPKTLTQAQLRKRRSVSLNDEEHAALLALGGSAWLQSILTTAAGIKAGYERAVTVKQPTPRRKTK